MLEAIDRYYDAAPREHARAEEVAGFTVFVGPPGGWTFAARPQRGWSGEYDAAAVAALVARMTDLGLPVEVEWVHELAPTLRDAVLAEGTLEIEETPLMVLGARRSAPAVEGVRLRMLGPGDDDAFTSFNGVARISFDPSAPEDAGPAERESARRTPSPQALEMLRSGRARVAVAEHPEHGVVAGGRHIERDGVTEVVGVATLPAFRRSGLASAVTRLLLDDAEERGCATVFLTASSPAVAARTADVSLRVELLSEDHVSAAGLRDPWRTARQARARPACWGSRWPASTSQRTVSRTDSSNGLASTPSSRVVADVSATFAQAIVLMPSTAPGRKPQPVR